MERGVGKGKSLALTSSSTTRDPPKRCPRCDSTNTKFCYYNNYSQSQPRHFCRACRRYWTEGGTLRNVLQGGGTHHQKVKRPRKSCAAASSSAATADAYNPVLCTGLEVPVTVAPPPSPPPPPLYLGEGMMAALFQPLIQTGSGLMAGFSQAQYSQPILPAGFVNIPIQSQLPPQFEPIMAIPPRFAGSGHDDHHHHQMNGDHNNISEFNTGSGPGGTGSSTLNAAGGNGTDHQGYNYWNINSELNDGGDGGPPRPPTP